jgi:hypothetical protein
VLRVELRTSAAKLERCQLCRENNAPGFRGKWSIGFDLYSTRCKVKARDRFSWRVKHRFTYTPPEAWTVTRHSKA